MSVIVVIGLNRVLSEKTCFQKNVLDDDAVLETLEKGRAETYALIAKTQSTYLLAIDDALGSLWLKV